MTENYFALVHGLDAIAIRFDRAPRHARAGRQVFGLLGRSHVVL
jgi:hypothetical protein